MKAMLTRTAVILGLAAGLGCGSQVFGDTTVSLAKEKTMKGVAARIDQAEKTLRVRGFWGIKRLNVANNCKVSLQDKPDASLADLHAGQKLAVAYQNVQGVLVAHQIAQQNLIYTGFVKALDPANHNMTLRRRGVERTFRIAENCKVVLRDEKTGALSDVLPGHRVNVTYEIPNGADTACQIAQTSASFSGALTAIDLNDRTLKAKTLLGAKKFNVGDPCVIVMSGKPDAKLSDLKLGDKLVLSYDDVNGVNIVNRIAAAEAAPEPARTASRQSANSGTQSPPPNN